MTEEILTIAGWCPICEHPAVFVAKGTWYRGTLQCQSCEGGSVPRERALAHVLAREAPHWRLLDIHESSPAERGISRKFAKEGRHYIASHYFPGHPLGEVIKGYRNEDIERQTFGAESFDIVVSMDVTEHVFNPGAMFREIYRTLRPGGLYISTFPIHKHQTGCHIPRFKLSSDGCIEHLAKPEYHGNPVNGDGALVTFDYGYEIHKTIALWAPFDVEVSRFCNRYLGILGEFTEVIVCRKRAM